MGEDSRGEGRHRVAVASVGDLRAERGAEDINASSASKWERTAGGEGRGRAQEGRSGGVPRGTGWEVGRGEAVGLGYKNA